MAAGLSHRELAARARVSVRQLALMEAGENTTLEYLERVVRALSLRSVSIGALTLENARDFSHARRMALAVRDSVNDLIAALGGTAESEGNLLPFSDRRSQEMMIADAPFRRVNVIAEEEVPVPIVGYVAAGAGIDLLTQGHGEYRTVPISEVPRDPGWVALEAKGESMIEFGINDGDLVYVEPRKGGVAANGEIVIGWLSSREGLVIKKWYAKKGKRMLLSGNPDYDPIEITEEGEFELQAIVRYVVPRFRGREFPNISGRKKGDAR